MAFPTPLPPLFPRLTYQIPRGDVDKDSAQSLIPSIFSGHSQNQQIRSNSQDNKFLSDIDREEIALEATVSLKALNV